MFKKRFSRRAFLRTALGGVLILGGGTNALAKKMYSGPLPEGTLSLYNTHNSERLTINFRKEDGNYDLDALNALNHLLRCHFTNEQTTMDVNTIEYLNLLDKQLGGGNDIHIISGYRSPSYNSLLRHEGRHVAKNSLHLVGKAIDISIPGIPLERVRHAALSLRMGGVGYYPGAGFLHIDSGTFRTW